MQAHKPWTIVAYGDSWTYGSAAEGFDEAVKHADNREFIVGSWVSLLRRSLSATHPGTTVINQGHGGWTSEQGDAQLGELVLSCQPDLLILNFGINDWKQPLPLDRYIASMQRIIERTRDAGCQVLLWTSGPVSAKSEQHYGWSKPRDDSRLLYKFAEISRALHELAARHKVELADVQQVIHHRWETGEDLSGWFYDDIHFLQQGHNVIFEQILASATKMIDHGGRPATEMRQP